MAKRRRLTPFDPDAVPPLVALRPRGPDDPPRPPRADREAGPARPLVPIAAVAGEASARAALDALAGEVAAIRAAGRMVEMLPLAAVDPDHLIRDRMTADADDMAALVESLRVRGQQAPVEVVALRDGRYGLISGWRRLRALGRLHAETGEDRFAAVAALVRAPGTAAGGYLAMVEENEIRAGLTFYERARLAAEAARIGVYADVPEAIAALYARATPARRSKIASFVVVHDHLDAGLRHGPAIPERLGLALAGALRDDDGFGPRLRAALAARPAGEGAADAAAERAVLERALRAVQRPPRPTPREARGETLAPGLVLEARPGRAVLSGPALDAALLAALRDWLAARG